MTTFLLDLWQDLRAKRLWPVAVALVAATVAVPVLLSKPASSPLQSSGAGQVANASKLPTVTLDASSVEASHLDVFKQKNPFASAGDTGGSGTGTGTGTSTGNSVGSSVASAGSGGTSANTSSSSSSSGGGSGAKAPTGPDGKPISPGVHYFTYTADLHFGPRSDVKSYKGVAELDVLPDGKSPIVAFMGVKDAKTAMFFIADPAFRADGEGECQPSPANCMFLYLRTDVAHNEETLSAQNGQVEYTLTLDALHVKMLDKGKAVGTTTPSKPGGSQSKQKSRGTSKAEQLRALERATLLSMPTLGLAAH